ncbi:MAG: hypothetical protein P3W87_005165 [Gammaproteobacteria bacterium]|nr:hypothetical protein [Gammaproteobacteria bacterium]
MTATSEARALGGESWYAEPEWLKDLLLEMVMQTIRDMALLRDEERCLRLQRTNPEAYEDIVASSTWFDTTFGKLALQMVFPDWEPQLLVQHIQADPQGVVKRFGRGPKGSASKEGFPLEEGACPVYDQQVIHLMEQVDVDGLEDMDDFPTDVCR